MLMTHRKTLRQLAGVLETANLLFIRLLLANRAKARVFPNQVHADYMYLGGHGHWQCKSIFDFLPELKAGRVRVVLEHLPGEGMTTPVNELAFMAMVTRAVAPKKVFEFGTYRGRTALNFALNSSADCQIYTLDLPPEHKHAYGKAGRVDAWVIESSSRVVGLDYQETDVAAKIQQLYGDSMEFDFTPFHDSIDLVFVDGGHAYDVAARDTENALRMCRPGGIILWHDFANYGEFHDVTRAVLDRLPGSEVVQLENSWVAAYRKPTGG
jgi:predicted O-methyltransferase YrrM